jgi:hypothetical protein
MYKKIFSSNFFDMFYVDVLCSVLRIFSSGLLLVIWLLYTGKFRHLPVVEHGEVIAMLDITKFLYDAISRMEKAAEQGSAIAAAMEGVERQWGNEFTGYLFQFLLVISFNANFNFQDHP